MKTKTILVGLLALPTFLVAIPDSIDVYLLPGQGGDHRLFSNFSLSGPYRIHHIRYHRPTRGASMARYAKELSHQIDTSGTVVLVGVSLGGMFATEISALLPDVTTITVSSAKCRSELPGRYRFQRYLPIYKLVPPQLALWGAKLLQPIVEPDRRREAAIFKAMLRDKDPVFLRRTIAMIMEWERTEAPFGVLAIHGDRDRTIPIRNVRYNRILNKGSHMITLTRGTEVSSLVQELVEE